MIDQLVKGIEILDGKALVKASEDLLSLELAVPKDNKISREDIRKGVKDVKNKFGISFGLLSFPEKNGDNAWIIAKGRAPEDGEDAKILILGQDFHKERGVIDNKGGLHIINVKKGEIVAKKEPPTPGTPGKDILGREIPAQPGKWVPFQLGQGVEISENDQELVAVWDGKLEIWPDGTINVLNEWTIDDSVGPATGNIEFWGRKLAVTGSVLGGFIIKVKGRLHVEGGVEDGAVVSTKGDLVVNGIVRSKNTKVFVGGDLFCRAIEYAQIHVRGDLEVEEYVLDSKCDIGGHFFSVDGKGLVVGGTLRVGRSIAVKVLGTGANVPTRIFAGFDPDVRKGFEKAAATIETLAQKIEKVKSGLAAISKMEESGKLSAKHGIIKEKLEETLSALLEETDKEREKMVRLQKELGQMQAAVIQVLERAHANTILGVYNASICLKQDVSSSKFTFSKGRILREYL